MLELRARIVRRMGARLCAERGAIAATTLPRVEPAGFSRDGFHASIEGYAYVANHLVTYVVGDAAAWSSGAAAGSSETAPD